MNDKKAVIISIKGQYAVVYTRDRRFIKIPVVDSHWVGQIIHLDQLPKRYFTFGWQLAAATAVTILGIFMAGIFSPFSQPPAEAYLSLGLNSSGAELWVGPDNEVIKVNYTGDQEALKDVNVKGLNVYQAVTDITNKASESGLIKDDDRDNLFLLNYANLSDRDDYIQETKIKQSVEAGLHTKTHGVIVVNKNNKHYVAEASGMGLTATQYYVLETSRASGHNITADQIKHGHIRTVLQEAGTTPEELFIPVETKKETIAETKDYETRNRTYVHSNNEMSTSSTMSSNQIYIHSGGEDSKPVSGTGTLSGSRTDTKAGIRTDTGMSTGRGKSFSTDRDSSTGFSSRTMQRSNYKDTGQAEFQRDDFTNHGSHAGETKSFGLEHSSGHSSEHLLTNGH